MNVVKMIGATVRTLLIGEETPETRQHAERLAEQQKWYLNMIRCLIVFLYLDYYHLMEMVTNLAKK